MGASDLAGRRFGRLVAVEKSPEKQDKYALWRCKCDCGGEALVTSRHLTRGTVTDCGCGAENLTGQVFGALTVVEKIDGRQYRCRCECGTEINVFASDLKRGHTKSCGCLKTKPKGSDISGLRSGKLVAIEPTDQMRRGATLWRCRCDCGREILAEGYRIQSGRVLSCGCSRVGKAAKDLTGQRFGELTALRRLDEKEGSCYLWLCRCSCGKEVRMTTNRLLHGNALSCGHLRDPRLYMHYIEGTCVEKIGSDALRSDNTSGHAGVVRVKDRWRASITFKQKTYYLGEYPTFEEAVEIRRRAEDRIFGEFLEWYEREFCVGSEKAAVYSLQAEMD